MDPDDQRSHAEANGLPNGTLEDTPNTELTMVRDDLASIPEYSLPAGYRFRTYRAGDDAVWVSLHRIGEPFIHVSHRLFEEQFGGAMDALDDRMFFVETLAGQPVGTITAWWEKDRHALDESGRIHWVIVHPEHRGLGIAKAMMTKAMRRLLRSHARAMLGTSARRLHALKLYLDFGFLPKNAEMQDLDVARAWWHVQSVLEHPRLQEFLSRTPNVNYNDSGR